MLSIYPRQLRKLEVVVVVVVVFEVVIIVWRKVKVRRGIGWRAGKQRADCATTYPKASKYCGMAVGC